jgi:hypothetical protein
MVSRDVNVLLRSSLKKRDASISACKTEAYLSWEEFARSLLLMGLVFIGRYKRAESNSNTSSDLDVWQDRLGELR